MISNQPYIKRFFLILDLLLYWSSCALAWYISRLFLDLPTGGDHHFLLYTAVLSSSGLLFYVLSYYFNNLYKRQVLLSRYRHLILIIKSLFITCALVLLVAVIFFHSELVQFGRLFIGVLFVSIFFLSVFFRIGVFTPFIRVIFKKKLIQRRLLIIGGDDAGQHVARSLQNDIYANFNIVGFVDDYKEPGEVIPVGEDVHEHFHNLGRLDQLAEIVKKHQVDEILIAIDKTPYQRLIHIVDCCFQVCPVIRIYSDFLTVIAKKLRVEFYSGIPVIMLSQYSLDSISWKVKRLLDILLSAGALVVLSPLLAIIAIGIKVSSPGPVFFKQIRIGKNGIPFDFYKFRSMHVGNDSSNHKEFVQNFIKGDAEKECEEIKVFKITSDPRIFKLGAFIRKSSLDEFPQLFNVLKGDMTLVGPRPCLPYEWDCYDEWHKSRLNVLPGCTGMWQALGRSSVSFEEMVVLDLYYISNMTPWLDLKIILLTFPVIFLAKGGY